MTRPAALSDVDTHELGDLTAAYARAWEAKRDWTKAAHYWLEAAALWKECGCT